MKPQDEALSVTQADRDAAAAYIADDYGWPNDHLTVVAIRKGMAYIELAQAFAAHRLAAHSTPGDAEVRMALELCADVLPRFVHSRSDDDKHVAGRRAYQATLAALATPSGRAQGEVDA